MKTVLALWCLFSLVVFCVSCSEDDNGGIVGNGNKTFTLKNDGYVAGQSVSFVCGLTSGEEAAATLGPASENSVVRRIQFLYGGAGGTENITIRIYLDVGSANPGTELFAGTYSITASNDALQEVDLSAQNIILAGGTSIRVSLVEDGDNCPSVAADTDGSIQPGRNWLYANIAGLGWYDYSDVLGTGDFVIRAIIETQ